MSDNLPSPLQGVSNARIAEILRGRGITDCTFLKEHFMLPGLAHILVPNDRVGTDGAAGAAAPASRPPRICMFCVKGPNEHPTLADIGLAGPTPVTGAKRGLADRNDLERIVKRPRFYGPDDPPEIQELTQKPFAHLSGLVHAELSRAHAIRVEAEAAANDNNYTTKFFTGDVELNRERAKAVAGLVAERADGLDLCRRVLKEYHAREFERLEAANTELRVFYPKVRELVSDWATLLNSPPDATADPFIRLARAVRSLDQKTANDLYKELFYDCIKNRMTQELDRLKALARARSSATGAGATAQAAGTGSVAGSAIPSAASAAAPPAGSARTAQPPVSAKPGRDGSCNEALVCTHCRNLGHLAGNCPSRPANQGGNSSGNKGGPATTGSGKGNGNGKGGKRK
jgi:hypothetical protein